jgi:hypothetical protein
MSRARTLGAAADDVFAQARVDLSSTVGAQIVAGDTALNAGQYSSAVTAYQQAGQVGATVVGPEIDGVGYSNATQGYTQQAWQLNTSLAAIPAASATQANAITAQALAYKMQQLYLSGIDAGDRAANPPSSAWPVLITLAGIGVAGGVILGFMDLHHKRTTMRASRAPTRRYSTR